MNETKETKQIITLKIAAETIFYLLMIIAFAGFIFVGNGQGFIIVSLIIFFGLIITFIKKKIKR